MEFHTVGRSDPDYAKRMMQSHLQKKKRNMTLSDSVPASQLPPNYSKRQNFREINEEEQRMKKIWKEQIEQSLQNYKNKKTKQQEEEKKVKKIMAAENGILDYMENQISKRNKFIDKCMIKQQNMKRSYIDDDARKSREIRCHINLNYDQDVFNHESDKYQAKQKVHQALTWMVNSQQKEEKKWDKKIEEQEYGKYFEEKYRSDTHNPIINPKEYHIDNKYILRKMR